MVDLGFAELGFGILRAGYRMRPARLDFRAPEQRIWHKKSTHMSWWFVPIAVCGSTYWRKVEVPAAAAYFELGQKTTYQPPKTIPLCWQDPRNVPDGPTVDEFDLKFGRVGFIPLARRDETGNGSAEITSIERLRNTDNNKHIIPENNKIRFSILIRSGAARWQQSPQFYVLNVPPKGVSNGQFTLELRYGDAAY